MKKSKIQKICFKKNILKKFLGQEVSNLFILAVIIGFLWFLIETSFVYIIQSFLVSLKLVDSSHTFLPTWFPVDPISCALIMILFGLFRGTVVMMKIYVSGTTNQAFIRHQRKLILSRSLNEFSGDTTHETVTLISETVTNAGVVLLRVSELLNSATSLVFFSLVGIYLAPVEFILGSFILGLWIYPLKKMNTRITLSGEGLNTELTNVNKTLLQGIRNNLLLRIYGRINEEIKKGYQAIDRYEVHYKNFYRILAFKFAFPQFIGTVVISVVTIVSLKFLHTAPMKLISFFYVFIRLCQGASEANNVLSDLKLHRNSIQKLFDYENKSNIIEPTITQSSKKLQERIYQIEFTNVSFSFDRTIFKDINLKLKVGDILLIKGESGAGKTTLLSLACGILMPTLGKVSVNSNDIKEEKLDFHENIGYVGPEPFLISGSIRDNLQYGANRKYTDEEMRLSLKRGSLEDLLTQKDGLDYFLNEQAQLSTGQKQRLSIARAILRNPSLLILDEATSNLDKETENQIVHMLKEFATDRISIIVSHRNSFDSMATNQLLLIRKTS